MNRPIDRDEYDLWKTTEPDDEPRPRRRCEEPDPELPIPGDNPADDFIMTVVEKRLNSLG